MKFKPENKHKCDDCRCDIAVSSVVCHQAAPVAASADKNFVKMGGQPKTTHLIMKRMLNRAVMLSSSA